MSPRNWRRLALLAAVLLLLTGVALAQDSNIRVQCPATTELHSLPGGLGPDGSRVRCDHLAAGDGFATMGDGTPLYIFGFSRLPYDGDPVAPGIQPVDPDAMMMQGMVAANLPAPVLVADEGDELYLTLTNVGMTYRPDLFDPHSVHWHGFPQAASVFDGVPDSSIAINMAASFTYYYLANDPGTYFYHCHVEATEHMQMGMLGSLYVKPRQNRCLTPGNGPCPPGHVAGHTYAYNDGDGSTRYDVDYPIQITSFDPAFHEASVGVNPLPFADMKDTYFLLNGRSYPDTVQANCLPQTVYPGVGESNGQTQCQHSLITATPGQRILLRLSNASVTEYATVGTIGIPMRVVGRDARLLRGDDGLNQDYLTNSITLGGGESADVILDTTGLTPGTTYFLYATNLNFLSNDAENFGGLMTEIRIQ